MAEENRDIDKKRSDDTPQSKIKPWMRAAVLDWIANNREAENTVSQEVKEKKPNQKSLKPGKINVPSTANSNTKKIEANEAPSVAGNKTIKNLTSVNKKKKKVKKKIKHNRKLPASRVGNAVSLPLLESKKTLALPEGHKARRLFRISFISLWLAFLGLHVVAVWQNYTNSNAQNAIALRSFVPLPHAVLETHPVLYSAIDNEVQALRFFYSQQKESVATTLTEEALRQIVQETIKRRMVSELVARRHNVYVTHADVQAELARLAGEAGSLENLKLSVDQLWGWSLDDYRRKVLRPFLVKKQLLEKLQEDPVISRELSSYDIGSLDQYLDKQAEHIDYWVVFAK